MIATMTGLQIPFNNYLTGEFAYNHKAGMHLKAIMLNPGSYEIIPPEAFGVSRNLQLGSRLTGKHAIASRVSQLGLVLADADLIQVTRHVKTLADDGDVPLEQLDALLHEAACQVQPQQGHDLIDDESRLEVVA
jgi:homocitrate synthase